MVQIGNEWDVLLKDEFKKDYYLNLRSFLKKEYATYNVYPDMHDIFNALKYVDYKDVKVVILGQDPYINKGEAHGFAFSVQKGIKVPPSLKNVYKELQDDIGCKTPSHGNLLEWVNEGVLLLNTVLTVKEKASNSHKGKGWEILTDAIIKLINQKDDPVVFMLWGNNAKQKSALLDNEKHLVLKATHPSPLARGGFFGCKHFSKCNEFLENNGQKPIDWQIND